MMTAPLPLVVKKALRYKKAPPVPGYKFPPWYMEACLFKKKFFITDQQLVTLIKERKVYGFSFHGKGYITVNPCITWEWTPDDIKTFWTPS